MASFATCYDLHNGVISINNDDLPCADTDAVGHNVTCCVRGSTCLSNGICENKGGTGYYSADCTDPTLQSDHCMSRCGGLIGSQITWNETSQLWACCTYVDGKANCSDPSNQLFAAPAPSYLSTILSLPTTGVPSYSTPFATATSTDIGLTTTAGPSSSSSSCSSSVSAGAAVGIGIGTAAGCIIVASLATYFLRKMKRRPPPQENKSASIIPSRRQKDTSELGSNQIMDEFYGSHPVAELDAKVQS